VLLLAACPVTVRGEGGGTLSQACVLWEFLTMKGCMGCGTVKSYQTILNSTMGTKKVAFVDLWLFSSPDGNSDQYIIDARGNWYDSNSTKVMPQVYIDGSILVGPGAMAFDDYKNNLDVRYNVSRDYEISVSGSVVGGSVNVHLTETGSSSANNLYMKYYVLENNVNAWLPFVARTILPSDAVSSIPPGGMDFTKTYSINPGWNPANLSFVAFLQSDTNKEVQQAVYYDNNSPVPEMGSIFVLPAGSLLAMAAVLSIRRKD
jgi:hypothetical protein